MSREYAKIIKKKDIVIFLWSHRYNALIHVAESVVGMEQYCTYLFTKDMIRDTLFSTMVDINLNIV